MTGPSLKEQQLQREIAKLRLEKERLARQLQVEKEENLRSYRFTSAKSLGDQDDDEVPRHSEVKNEPRSLGVFDSFQTPTNPHRPTNVPQGPGTKKKPVQTAHKPNRPLKPTIDDARHTKRKRSEEDDFNEDLAFFQSCDFSKTLPPRTKRRTSTDASPEDDQKDVEFGFEFQAITEWHDGDTPEELSLSSFQHNEIKGCGELVDRIQLTKDIWENNCGTEWQFDFERTDSKGPMCVTTKTAGYKTKWRSRDKQGRYACRECVVYGRPCFRYTVDGGFELLPLHPQDRMGRVVRGKTELCYWVNDNIEFSAADMWIGGEGDEDYTDDDE